MGDGLTSAIEFKGVRCKNRIAMPPMATEMSTTEGEVTPEIIEHYGMRAERGVGMIIVEHSFVNLQGKRSPHQLGIQEDGMVSGLKRLADTIKKGGAVAGIQINHCGSKPRSEMMYRPYAPSVVENPGGDRLPQKLNTTRINRIRKSFASAAARAQKAGFDFVEIHGAHGFLLNQFYSPLTNKRQDEYGGDRDSRLHFLLEVVRAVRDEVGEDYPLAFRLGADDRIEGGLTIEDGLYAAIRLEESGVDLLDFSGGHCGYLEDGEQGFFMYMAEEIKPEVDIPVLITGGVRKREYAERVLSDNRVDLVGVGRPLLKEPGFVENWVD